ncbi:hypothetical protein [Bacillus thuringiensis]|uniref:hypothetical protein n=1 Tax=Bacillus thuringiensis TaxID=1428 RepID=UPI000BFDF7C4|nr:hypothetical protein [Bacillus thuringiensis]PGM50874.1 hypothetical protein CN949_16415 [Bacillus thuringiensis]
MSFFVNEVEEFTEEVTTGFWYDLNDILPYETVIIIKNFVSVLPFILVTFVLTVFFCSWLYLRIRKAEHLEGVSLIRVPTTDGKDKFYFTEPKRPLDVIESIFTFFVWRILFKKTTIAFRDYKKSRIIFLVLLIITIIITIYGIAFGFSVVWYPEPRRF